MLSGDFTCGRFKNFGGKNMGQSLGSQANTDVQKVIDGLVADGKEIGIQVCAYLGEECVVDCWSGVTELGGQQKVDAHTLFSVLRMPSDVTPELMTNWDWMCRRIAEMPGEYPAGSRSTYQSMTFGWMMGEIVRRTDPKRRPFGQFVQQEIAEPLGCTDLWLGIPDAVEPRIATLNAAAVYVAPDGNIMRAAQPLIVDLMPDPFERPYVRRACIPAVGGIFNARSNARFWALLANGGAFNGVRLLSEERVKSFAAPRPHFEDADPVFFGMVVPIGWAGYWLGGATAPPVCAPRNMRALCHPGMGGNIGWADMETKLAVGMTHNLMFDTINIEEDTRTIIGDTIRNALGLA
jgi:CubicO group peptidase (beta-lactamase class C family)